MVSNVKICVGEDLLVRAKNALAFLERKKTKCNKNRKTSFSFASNLSSRRKMELPDDGVV